MRILVLGGTLFLGRHVVEAALEAGHDVTLFNRGITNPELFPEVEKLRGNRDGDLNALRGRSWDMVIDTSGYVPRIVDTGVEMLSRSVERYVFVSTCSVYADTSRPGLDESAPVARLANEHDEDVTASYGALKAACEEVVRARFGNRSAIVRAGLIVGPHDPTNRFTYWVTRLADGGRVVAPKPVDQPVQLIDARDLSRWIVGPAASTLSGTYNVTGPATPLTLGEALHQIRTAVDAQAELEWVDEEFLVGHGVEPWSELPLWLAPNVNPEYRGFLALDVGRALATGLDYRPLEVTARDTLEWAVADRPPPSSSNRERAGLSREREGELLRRWDEGSD